MARLTADNERRAKEAIALYPHARSALLPLLHLAQEQDGWLTEDAMAHVAELLDLTAADVFGTASFYDMFFTEPMGRHLVSICTNIACMLDGAYELRDHIESSLGIRGGATTPDGEFTLEEVECIALCDEAPCITVNWRFFGRMTPERFDRLADDLRAGKFAETVPPHGTLCRVRRTVGLTAGVAKEGRADFAEDEPAAPASQAPPPPEDRERAEAGREPVGTVAIATEEGAEVLGPPGADTEPELRGGLSEAARKESEAQAREEEEEGEGD